MTKSSFSDSYKKQCFDAWYLAGRPSEISKVRSMLPPNEYGDVPSLSALNRWRSEMAWEMYADDLDSRAIQISDNNLIATKVAMLKQHQEDAATIAKKALETIKADGFDSSASAVTAYFRATEEQRKTAGFSDLLERLDKMTNNDVEAEIRALLSRASANDQIVDAGVVDSVMESEDSSDT